MNTCLVFFYLFSVSAFDKEFQYQATLGLEALVEVPTSCSRSNPSLEMCSLLNALQGQNQAGFLGVDR